MDKIFFKPAKGVKIRDPKTRKHIPEEGAFVERSSYYIRRVKGKDGTFTDQKPVKKEKILDKEKLAKKDK